MLDELSFAAAPYRVYAAGALVAENPSYIRNGYVAGYGHPDLNDD